MRTPQPLWQLLEQLLVTHSTVLQTLRLQHQDLSDVDQDLATTDSVTFAGVTAPLTGDVTGDVTGDLTGNVTGNVTGNLTGTVQTASQLLNITSVGTLSSLTISGDLTVDGTTTTINSTTLSVDDKNITLGDTSSPSDSAAQWRWYH